MIKQIFQLRFFQEEGWFYIIAPTSESWADRTMVFRVTFFVLDLGPNLWYTFDGTGPLRGVEN